MLQYISLHLFEAKLFKEISQTKSISRAATHCGISQSAATQHVQEVERRLGLPLVDRSTRPLSLTEAGKLYADFCREVLRREDQFLVALERLKGQNREEVYGWVNQTLRQQRYEVLKRSGRGLVRRYVEKMTGLSRAQTTRLITVYLGGDEVKPQPYRRRRFARRYTREDIALLAGVD